MQPPPLLALPTDILRMVLSAPSCSPTLLIVARFVCRHFRDLIPISDETFQLAHEFCDLAEADDYLNLLKRARGNGCRWDAYTCAAAAAGGHLEVLQWARANGCPWNGRTCAQAAHSGHLKVLQWA